MTPSGGELQLRLPARAENVALVRQALSGVAETIPVDPALLADMKTAVTEACNNVVLHAYRESQGVLEVEAAPDEERVTIVVRDHGGGMQPKSVEPDEPSLGLGLPLIAALSDRFEIHGGTGRGIEVRMMFLIAGELNGNGVDGTVAVDAPGYPAHESGEAAAKAAGVAITPGPLMAPVIGRLTAMLASRADFSLDRLSDAVLMTDAIAAHVGSYIPGRHVSLAIQDGDGTLDLRVGPLVAGGAEKLLRTMELPGLDRSLQQLADEVKVEGGGAEAPNEYLLLRLSGAAGSHP
jgi:serine/threonine-protein kinase RsbW